MPLAVINKGKHVVSVASFIDCIVCGTIAAEPSKLTPPIVRGVARVVAVVAFPVKAPTKVVAFTVLAKVALWVLDKVKAVVATLPAVVVWNVKVLLTPVPASIVILLAPPVILPTEVKEPVTSAEPLKFCPQSVRVVVKVAALPVVF